MASYTRLAQTCEKKTIQYINHNHDGDGLQRAHEMTAMLLLMIESYVQTSSWTVDTLSQEFPYNFRKAGVKAI